MYSFYVVTYRYIDISQQHYHLPHHPTIASPFQPPTRLYNYLYEASSLLAQRQNVGRIETTHLLEEQLTQTLHHFTCGQLIIGVVAITKGVVVTPTSCFRFLTCTSCNLCVLHTLGKTLSYMHMYMYIMYMYVEYICHLIFEKVYFNANNLDQTLTFNSSSICTGDQ